MDEISVRKNVLDLEHSETLSRGITELSIAIGGFLSILERCVSIRKDILTIVNRKGHA